MGTSYQCQHICLMQLPLIAPTRPSLRQKRRWTRAKGFLLVSFCYVAFVAVVILCGGSDEKMLRGIMARPVRCCVRQRTAGVLPMTRTPLSSMHHRTVRRFAVEEKAPAIPLTADEDFNEELEPEVDAQQKEIARLRAAEK